MAWTVDSANRWTMNQEDGTRNYLEHNGAFMNELHVDVHQSTLHVYSQETPPEEVNTDWPLNGAAWARTEVHQELANVTAEEAWTFLGQVVNDA